jgi:hypothetical protein
MFELFENTLLLLCILFALVLQIHCRVVHQQTSEADEAVIPRYSALVSEAHFYPANQVKALLDLEKFVHLGTRGLKPISNERLQAEAKALGWVAVRALALEWFDALPARAFEAHALIPMCLSLLPKREDVGVSVIRNLTLHTRSPLIHEWAMQHRFLREKKSNTIIFVHSSAGSPLSGEVYAEPATAAGNWDFEESHDSLFDTRVRSNAVISRCWLWRMHFLKVCHADPQFNCLLRYFPLRTAIRQTRWLQLFESLK